MCQHPWGERTFLTCADWSQVDCNLVFGRGFKKKSNRVYKKHPQGLKYTRNRLTYPILYENSPKSRLEGRKTPQRCLERWGGLCSIMRDRYSWWTGLDWSLWATTRNKPEDALTCSASSDDISALSLLLLRSETLTHTPPIFTRRDRWRNTEVVCDEPHQVLASSVLQHRWDFGKVRRWTFYPASGTEQKRLQLEHRLHDLKEEERKKMHEGLPVQQWSDR